MGMAQHNHKQVIFILNMNSRTHLTKSMLYLNRVDESRIKDVGADRAAAEWLLRCGAGVKWRGSQLTLTDYNSLPPGNYRTLLIEEIDASNSCIMSVGFPHLSKN